LKIYTLYKNPKDFPGEYVIRKTEIDANGAHADANISIHSKVFQEILDFMAPKELFWINRNFNDAPCIEGFWI